MPLTPKAENEGSKVSFVQNQRSILTPRVIERDRFLDAEDRAYSQYNDSKRLALGKVRILEMDSKSSVCSAQQL